jgi:hypothetical protein
MRGRLRALKFMSPTRGRLRGRAALAKSRDWRDDNNIEKAILDALTCLICVLADSAGQLAQYCDPKRQSDAPDAPRIYCLDEYGRSGSRS